MLHAGEKGRHAEVIVLSPFLKWMVMTLGTLHADAEKQLGRCLRQILRIGRDAVIIGRWVRIRAPRGGQQLAYDLVERNILFDAVAEPVLVDVRPLHLDGFPVAAEHVAPL